MIIQKSQQSHPRLFLLLLLLAFCPVTESFVSHHHQSHHERSQPEPAPRRFAATGAASSLSSLSLSSTSVPLGNNGLRKTIAHDGLGPAVNVGDIATVRYTCYSDHDRVVVSRSNAQKVVVGDGTMIPGWDQALKTMRVGERSYVQIPSELAYGSTGVPPIIPPNAALQLELHVLDTQSPTANIDFDSLAMADKTPRTASDIAAAFEKRQAVKALQGPAKEGLEGWIEKAKNFYFFGLFEGETGERPPWFLRPSITFPLAFLVVGAAFYITFAGGAIYERGAQVKDELDEFIVSYNSVAGEGGLPPLSLALAIALLSGVPPPTDFGL